jgi:mRNA interferase RelE/StbE
VNQAVAFQLRVPDEVATTVKGLHPELKQGLRAALKTILDESYSGKPLKDELDGLRSFRVKRFRIIYQLTSGREIHIIAIGPRKRIYEDTYRVLQRGIDR